MGAVPNGGAAGVEDDAGFELEVAGRSAGTTMELLVVEDTASDDWLCDSVVDCVADSVVLTATVPLFPGTIETPCQPTL